MAEFLEKIGKTWYYRRDVPREFRELVGKRIWRQSLRTTKRNEAERLARALATEHDVLLTTLRTDPQSVWRERIAEHEHRSIEALNDIRRSFYLNLPRSRPPSRYSLEELAERTKVFRDAQLHLERERDELYRKAGLKEERREIERIRFMEAGLELTPAEEPGPDASDDEEALFLGRQQQHQRELETLRNQKAQLKGCSPAPMGCLSRRLEEWLEFKTLTPEVAKRHRSHVNRFITTFGDVPADRITRKQIREYVDLLRQLPDVHRESLKIQALPVRELVALGRTRPDLSKMKPASVRKAMDSIRSLFKFCHARDYIDADPTANIVLPQANASSRATFKPAESRAALKECFRKWGEQNFRTWAVAVAIFTGMRIGEIVQLTKNDLIEIDGVKAFSINENDGKRVKNRTSIRNVPIHPFLVELGLLKWIKKRDTEWLFATGKRAGYDFGIRRALADDIFPALGLADRQLTFHSFRHAFADACRNGRLPPDVRHRLMGHAEAHAVAGAYGEGHDIEILAGWIEKVQPLGADIRMSDIISAQ